MSITHEAEQSLLAAVLADGKRMPPGLDKLRPGHFADPTHAALFRAAQSLDAKGEPIDEVTIKAEVGAADVRKDLGSFLASLTEAVVTSANAPHYARIVIQESMRRDMRQACARAFDLAKHEGARADKIMEDLTLELARLEEDRETTRPVAMRELVRAEFKAIEHRFQHGEVLGMTTGFVALDRLLGGLEPSGLVIIGGRASMGKTTLATNIAENMVLRDNKRVLVFSLEMTRDEQARRSIASEARVELHRIRTGRLADYDWPKLAAAIGRLDTDRLLLVDKGGLSISELRSIARQSHSQQPLDAIVVDYLQLMGGAQARDGREQEVAAISRGLKALAMELRIPVIALSQLNRGVEGRSDKRPMLSDLRESGSLEQDASQVLLVYRDDYYHPDTDQPGIAEIIVAKNRNGPPGMVKLRWSGKFTRFESLEAHGAAA